MAIVKVIAPKAAKPDTLRVAAYCRVSSDSADQLHSYAAQIKNYTQEINRHDGWELVDVYADEGLTGTRMDKREDFNRLLADCRKGKIDKVVVKSISRFARNTRDCLATLRELSALGVTVRFEKEDIDTGTLTSELMVSVSGSLAQEESISISQNQRMSYQRRMEHGKFITCCAPLGYRIVDGKDLEIIPEEAEIVRWIFRSYLDGYSTAWIAAKMTADMIPTPWGRGIWRDQTIRKILTNEKYIGDSLCQKTYTTNAFPFVRKDNHGDADRYYVEHTHPAIIPREMFEKAQALLQRKGQRTDMQRASSPLARKMVCGICGSTLMRRTSKNGYTVWVCHKHDRKAANCPNGRVGEQSIHTAFLRMYHKLKAHEGIVLRPVLKQLDSLSDALHRDNPAMLAVNEAIAVAAEQSYNLSKLHTAGLLDAGALTERQIAINAKLAELRRRRRKLLDDEDIDEQADTIRQTVGIIQDGPEGLDGFDESLFTALVEQITLENQNSIRFRLYGGLEFRETLEGKK
ncbi:MAG: recombinase family protein [Pseudoflavonifractor capillosus]|uniref:recombinase family protein n=1 Tax=Pseudoflavonifractor capillosus TaxID=106588 RepID=UPI0023F8ED65|nr:recombinase family protein [Pseudoflavonifractor capillosus]MCI5929215.1 recombinase family protein [Pseudoflavonifractor capillosus]MDY4661446.1 recombinase family protein [Pseudoflavonifractor capillosus]